MPLYDFECGACGAQKEVILPSGETIDCEECGTPMTKIWTKAPPVLTNIVPMYPGCKRLKAGYQHTNLADHSAKIGRAHV